MDTLLSQLAHTVSEAHKLEDLARPMLEMLQKLTQLESTYLTHIDLNEGMQHVLYASNTQRLYIPEGLSVAWEDTLCKRALEEQCPYSADVSEIWGDSQAARALGIHTYASTPVRMANGALFGTLCAASAHALPITLEAQDVMRLFAHLIAQQVEREQLLATVQTQNAALLRLASTDALTGLPNRRAMAEQLAQLLELAARQQCHVLVAMIDMDGFKAINDRHGHEAGDHFLQLIAQQLQGAVRGSDLVARLGGDEFVFAGLGPPLLTDPAAALHETQLRIFSSTLSPGLQLGPELVLPYGGASVGIVAVAPGQCTPDSALQQADAQMYQTKLTRKQRH
ncbi:diguanylate cyclase [Comamonas odontotermitis]|uniref:diguanylate cyclase n=1 Tax=Comamonas odontotermitis TaxID=379895 RepID=A0ABR6RDS6_9BURK|nr:sensor domain-containing diguanylate cyclase [Comamonas odontotermitis]MBB6577307.1 diguanylate cyclase [Comamonas odontotermitis]